LYYLFHCKAHKERSCVLYFFADAENGRIQIRLRSTETA